MIVAVGVDDTEIARFARLLQNGSLRVYARICTDREREHCQSQERPHAALAARWSAKEAVAKCLGTGFASGVTPRSIEVVREPTGSLRIVLHGAAADAAKARGIDRVHISISHSGTRAIAFAVAESAPSPR